jgi:hypothetical protein
MKNTSILMLYVSIIGSLTSTVLNAQVDSTRVAKDSTVVISKLYGGMITGPSYDIESKQVISPVNVRVGAKVDWNALHKFTVSSFAFIQYDKGTDTWLGGASMYGKYSATNRLTVMAGVGPSLPAKYHRPLPVTSAGHFEVFTTSRLPGGLPTVNLDYNVGQETTISLGISQFGDGAMYATSFSAKKVVVTAYYLPHTNDWGSAVTITFPKVSTVLVKSHTDIVSNFTRVVLNDNKGIVFIADNGYGISSEEWVRSENGLLKTFSSKSSKIQWGGAFAVTYDAVAKRANSYLFLFIN